jgi:hypothetical protein
VSLEYLLDYERERKLEIIEEHHMLAHRGLNNLFRELNQRYYNIKQTEVKEVILIAICVQEGQRILLWKMFCLSL